MLKASLVCTGVGLLLCASLATTVPASAQQKQNKISYEEAFKRCKAYIDKEAGGLKHDTTNELTRTARGRACMEKFGHKL